MTRSSKEAAAQKKTRLALEQQLLDRVAGVEGRLAALALFNAFAIVVMSIVDDREEFDDIASRLGREFSQAADEGRDRVRAQLDEPLTAMESVQ